MFDALVIGTGPAGLSVAAALCEAGLHVAGLTSTDPAAPWLNTYGIWRDELEPLGLEGMLGHCWTNCAAYASGQELPLRRAYGLLNNDRLQAHLLDNCMRGNIVWHSGLAAQLAHFASYSRVTTSTGQEVSARIVIDASGHKAIFVQRPFQAQIAVQAAYGIVGRFSSAPVRPQQLVLMDYRVDHLTPAERAEPATFLYAMDLGNDVYFVEETSLAHYPAVGLDILENRLQRRLAYYGIQIEQVHHRERCLFPMNLPLPNLDQPVVGFGAAAAMVHPPSGYQVGAALRRAPIVARAIAHALNATSSSPPQIARSAWQALWPAERVRRRYLYLFGLANIMRFEQQQLQDFFATFFRLPYAQWTGYLSDRLSTAELLQTMLTLFGQAPGGVRGALMRSVGGEGMLLWNALIQRTAQSTERNMK